MALQDGQTARAVMNYYQVLEIAPDATPEDIKRAYRQLVRKHHPDVATEETGDRFHQIQAAYEILSDPGERRKYDLSVGWGRSPRTAIPYRPTQSKPRSTPQSSSQTPASKSPAPKSSPPKSTASPQATQPSPRSSQSSRVSQSTRSTRPGDRSNSARSGSSNRSKFDNTEFSNSGSSSTPQGQSTDRRAASSSSTTTGYWKPSVQPTSPPAQENSFNRDSQTREQSGTNSRSTESRSAASRVNGYANDRASDPYRGRPANGAARTTPIPVGSNGNSTSYTQRMRTEPAGNPYQNGTPSNAGRATTQDSKQASASRATNGKPYSPPPRPEPEVPNFNRGVKSLKEALRSNRYSVATEIADQLATYYSNRPLAMRLFVKAYHLRGNEMLYYKRYELAEIYLYEALKTAHSHYPELVKTIQADLDRMDTNRRELGMT